MKLWRYIAVAAGKDAPFQRGELAGESAAAVRASLRGIGLRVIDVRPAQTLAAGRLLATPEVLRSHLRRRRVPAKAELLDSLATMLDAGLPLLEAVSTLLRATTGRATRSMLTRLQESLKAGQSLSASMADLASWFDPVEIAMVRAGQHSGELASVLRSLAQRHHRTGELTSKLTSALAYPAIVACVGIGVVIFLSTRTLPQLVGVLSQARIPTPRLTRLVMGIGNLLADHGLLLVLGAVLLAAGALWAVRLFAREGIAWPRGLRRLVPATFRRVRLAQLASGLAELARSGVPIGESLRVLAPTFGGVLGASLRKQLGVAADRLEGGDELSAALSDEWWFDAEFRQLLSIGQASGELPTLLDRMADRYARAAKRAIDRMAALLEPAVILVLAALIGAVVMAAVLPMLRLQEVLR